MGTRLPTQQGEERPGGGGEGISDMDGRETAVWSEAIDDLWPRGEGGREEKGVGEIRPEAKARRIRVACRLCSQ